MTMATVSPNPFLDFDDLVTVHGSYRLTLSPLSSFSFSLLAHAELFLFFFFFSVLSWRQERGAGLGPPACGYVWWWQERGAGLGPPACGYVWKSTGGFLPKGFCQPGGGRGVEPSGTMAAILHL